MLLGFLIIWSLLFVVLKYDLKQNNITSIVRATCFTLISYIVLDTNFKESFKGLKKISRSGIKNINKISRSAIKKINKNKNSSSKNANSKDDNTTDDNTTDDNTTDDNTTDSSNRGPIETPDTTTVDENPITTQANSFKKMKDKCKYVKEQQRLTVNSLYQDFKNLKNSSSINDTQINVLQNNFNDLITVMQVGDVCFN
jgi:hypothetical protein